MRVLTSDKFKLLEADEYGVVFLDLRDGAKLVVNANTKFIDKENNNVIFIDALNPDDPGPQKCIVRYSKSTTRRLQRGESQETRTTTKIALHQ